MTNHPKFTESHDSAARSVGAEGERENRCWWLIYFEDADGKPEIFTDEATAKTRFKHLQLNWNCHLFKEEV